MTYDVAIIGGGLVGLATAYQISRASRALRVVVIEKENAVATHQSGRNSGVIHSGIYYKPGSQKAQNCRRGKELLESFCATHAVPYEICGKVIVATSATEEARLATILSNGKKNGVSCERIDAERLGRIEPFVKAKAAIHVPETGIVDYPAMARGLAREVRSREHRIALGSKAHMITARADGITVETGEESLSARFLINCAGLYSDEIARLCGVDPGVRVIPFRGEYVELRPAARHLCRSLIYPTPDPRFPFLGVHLTRTIDGRVECGPSAVLAFAREGYSFSSIDPVELASVLRYPGFRALALKYWRTGLAELWQSLSAGSYVRSLQRLVPGVRESDVLPAPSGVRAQAVTRNGELVDDFLIKEERRMLHVINAPSPAATSCLAIGEQLARRLRAQLEA